MFSIWKKFFSDVLFACIFVLIGAGIIAVAMDVIHMPPQDFHAPRIIVAIFGLVFFMAGLVVIVQAGVRVAGMETVISQWIQYLLILGIFAGVSVGMLWVGFGPQPVENGSDKLMFGLVGVCMFLGTIALGYFTNPRRIAVRPQANGSGNQPQ